VRRSPALLALLLLVAPVACGSDDEAARDETGAPDETEAPDETGAPDETEASTEAPDETEGASEPDDGDASTEGSGGSAGTVPAGEYAEGVCTSISTWYQEIETSSRALVEGASATAEDPATGKQLVVDFLDDAIGLTDVLTTDLEDAGVPDTETGPETADTLLGGIGDVQELFSGARADTEALPVDDEEALVTGLQDVGAGLQESATAVGANLEEVLSSVDDPELAEAFDAAPSCQELNPAG